MTLAASHGACTMLCEQNEVSGASALSRAKRGPITSATLEEGLDDREQIEPFPFKMRDMGRVAENNHAFLGAAVQRLKQCQAALRRRKAIPFPDGDENR